jgi:ribosomal protein S18 acetylase RimI-like enzyme
MVSGRASAGGALITVRPATEREEEALGNFGAGLVRQHHAADPRRFIHVEHPEAAYGRFLVSQITTPQSRVFVAEQSGKVVGYVLVALEPTNWMQLRGPCGVVHDLFVDESARRQGAGKLLLSAGIDWIRSEGRSQVVLLTMTGNEHAQSLFRALGFRSTMIEMTLDQA